MEKQILTNNYSCTDYRYIARLLCLWIKNHVNSFFYLMMGKAAGCWNRRKNKYDDDGGNSHLHRTWSSSLKELLIPRRASYHHQQHQGRNSSSDYVLLRNITSAIPSHGSNIKLWNSHQKLTFSKRPSFVWLLICEPLLKCHSFTRFANIGPKQ